MYGVGLAGAAEITMTRRYYASLLFSLTKFQVPLTFFRAMEYKLVPGGKNRLMAYFLPQTAYNKLQEGLRKDI